MVQPGDTVTFTITVENVGMGDALNLALTDTLPDCFSYVADTAQAVWPSDPADPSISPWIGDPLIDRHQLTFNIGATLNGGDPRGEMLTFTFQAYVGSGCNPQVTNYVMATGVDGDDNPIILYGIDADDTDNDDADDVPIRVLLPALEIEKSIVLINNGPPTATIKPGDIITYEIKISNTGFAPLTSLTVNDRIPTTAFLYKSGSSQYNGSAIADPAINGNQLTYSIDQTLDAGVTSTLRFSLEVTEALEHGMEYTNCADVVGIDGAGGEIYSNESCAPVNGFIPPNLTLVKTVASVNGQPSTGKVRLGDTVTYQIVLTNPGPADIINFTINDRIPTTAFLYKTGSSSLNGASIPDPTINGNELKYVINQRLNAGESATLEFSLTVTSAVRNGAIYTNCADATGMDETGTENRSNESCVDVEGYVPGEEKNITCKVSTSGLSNQLCAGGIAVYCMEITNETNLTIPGLIAQAQLPVGITFLNGTTVIDGVASPDPLKSGDTLSWTLPDLPAAGSIHLCFQISITANAQRGRQDFNFLIKDIEGNIVNCEVENIITVNDCGEGFCGYLEKIHMPYHECLRLTSLVDPKFNTSIAMYATGNFYNFARSERISPVGGSIYLEPDYDRLWRFRLLDIAEKNLDSLGMKPGIGIKLNDGIGYLEYSSAIPYFTKDEDKPINFWSSTIDKYIDLDSLGFTIFAQSERILTFSQKAGFFPGNTASIDNESAILEQLRSRVKLLAEWLDNKNLIREKPADHFPKTVEPEIKDNILAFRVTDDTSDLYSQSALLLGLSRYITVEKTKGNEGSNQENIAIAFKSIDSIIAEIRKLIDQYVKTEDNKPKEIGSIDLKGFDLAARALAELTKIDDRYSTEITDLQKIIWNLVTDDENRKWTSLYDRLAIAELSLSMYQTGGDNAYLERSLNTIESIDTDLWNEEPGLYHTNSPQGEYLYTPIEISQFINLYQYLIPHLEKEKADRLRTHINRFLGTVLLKGGMQLDDRWRRNQYLEISSGSEHQSTRAIFTTPLNQRLIPVLNEKIEFIDPATSSIPLSLSQYDASDIIKIENLVCDLSLAEPSRRLFITDIGSFALVELFATAQMIDSFTYPTYLLDYNPNEAWLLGQKMAEYAIYNSFALDYASRSGIDLRYSESEKMTEDQAIKLLSESVSSGASFLSPRVFKPLFVKFGTSLPGADKSIAEMLVYNPHLLGYREDRNIYSSAIGLNLARMVNEYRYLSSSSSRKEGYILPVIKQQMGSLVQFIKNHLSNDSGYNFNLPDHFYPYINSSGEPIAITGSETSADLFSYLAFIDGLLAYRNLNTDNPDSQLDEMITGLTRLMIGKFFDKEKGRFINSDSDKDISTINLYYLNHIAPEIEKVAGGSDIGLSAYLSGNLDLLRKEIISKEGKVKISLEGKSGKVSSIVDINTEPAAHCAALRMLLDEYRRTNKSEFLVEAKALYDSLKTKGYDELLRVFKGTEIVDERIQNEVRYHYNSFDIGMIIATLRDIIPNLEYKEKSAAIELLSVFFDKVVEGAEVQYLPYNEAGRTRLDQKFLPGIRTEVTVRYDKDTTLIEGAYPGDTVKFVVFIENRCGNLLAGSTSPDNLFDHLEVLDLLPPEFKYIPGSTYVNGVQGPDPNGERELVWQLKGISYDGVIVLSFLTDVTLNAVEGKYINYAKMGYFPAQEGTLMYSPTGFAQTTVTVLKPGKLYIRFFEDTNANGIWDENEKERFIPTYQVMLNNNLPITSDKDGRFAPYLIRPGQHTLTLSTFKIEDYWWATSTNPIIFSALVEKNTGINIPLVYKKVVEGYVYIDNNGDNKYDPGEGLKNVELITTTGQKIISGDDGYFYYFAQYPTETIKPVAEQRFNKTENTDIYIKE